MSLIARRVSALGVCAHGKDGFRVATVSLIACRVSTFGLCARGKDWFRVATVSLIACMVSSLGFRLRGTDWFRVAWQSARGVAEGHRPRDDGNRGKDRLRFARGTLTARGVSL